VALRALPLARPRLELPFVGIGCVAIHALGEGELLLEIASGMAITTTHLDVHPPQRIFRFRMIERLPRHVDFFPATRCVTGFARGLERPLVRVGMACLASIESYAREFDGLIGARGEVAFVAGNLRVKARERIIRFRMVELTRLFPVRQIMAALAVGAELSFMHIRMAGHAVLRESQIGTREVLLLDQRALRRNHVRWRMALLARDTGMLIHQRIAGQPMVELLEGRIPVNERKIYAVMFEVAPHALTAVGILHAKLRVESPMGCQPLRDLFMAVEAFECWCARPELVAGRALRSAAQILMRLGEGAGRDLGLRANPGKQDPQENHDP
jgi:hypothetical protein